MVGSLSSLFTSHEGASASARAEAEAEEDNAPRPFNSKTFAPHKHSKSEDAEPQRKRRRAHHSALPEPEVISLLSSDEEPDHLQRPHDPDSILGVHCSGSVMSTQFRHRTREHTDTAPILGAGEDEADRGTERVGMSLNAELHQPTSASSTEYSLATRSAIPTSSNPASHPMDQDIGRHDEVRIPIRELSLCPEQAELVDIILSGRNVFYTGSAGCGKSTVLKALTRRLHDSGLQVHIVAPTGISALGVGGSTTYVYAGWNPSSFKQPLDKLRLGAHRKHVRMRLKSTDVLVIDEISSK